MRTRQIINSLNGGEWSPLLGGRSDLEKYKNACHELRNVICFKHGGATRRPGTRFVAEVKDSTKSTRLLPFEFSTVQSYILEAGEEYLRFYKDNGRIEDPPATPVEIATPYQEADLFDIHFAQSADVMYLAHRGYAPRKLSRTSHTAWTLTAIDFLDGPYLPERDDITISPDGNTGSVTLTASAALFAAGHVGSVWRLKHGTTWTWFKITAYTSDTEVTADVRSASTTAAASDAFREGAWSGVRGYPAAVTLHQQRSVWGGTDYQPDTIWFSQTTEFENMDAGTAADDEAITFTLSSSKVNAIRWLASKGGALLVGTSAQEWKLTGAGDNEPITPASPNASAETTHGSNAVSPVEAHNTILFLQRAGRKLRELSFDVNKNAYEAPDLTILSEHITAGGIVQMDYQQELDSIVWLVRGDGALIGMTYEKAQDVIAWHKHVTGFAQDLTDGAFESVACIPHPTADEDQAWVIARRTINGTTKRYVEYLDTQGGYFGKLQVDSGLTYSGAATSTLTGLDHLEGQVVDVVGNGSVYPRKTVSGGVITGLSPAVTTAEVGIPFASKIVTNRPEQGSAIGTAQGAQKRFHQITVRLHESVGCSINGDQLNFRSAEDPMTAPIPVFTGDKQITNLGWNKDGRVTIEQSQPLPLTLLAVIGELVVNE